MVRSDVLPPGDPECRGDVWREGPDRRLTGVRVEIEVRVQFRVVSARTPCTGAVPDLLTPVVSGSDPGFPTQAHLSQFPVSDGLQGTSRT